MRRSKVHDLTLDRIWELVDINEKDYVDQAGFYLMLKLVAMAQESLPLNVQQAQNFSKSPTFYGNEVTSIGVGSISVGSISTSSGIMTIDFPIAPVTAADIERYDQLFVEADQNKDGFIDAEEGRGFFIRSQLPLTTLAVIWELADLKRASGKLEMFQFRKASILIYMALPKMKIPR